MHCFAQDLPLQWLARWCVCNMRECVRVCFCARVCASASKACVFAHANVHECYSASPLWKSMVLVICCLQAGQGKGKALLVDGWTTAAVMQEGSILQLNSKFRHACISQKACHMQRRDSNASSLPVLTGLVLCFMHVPYSLGVQSARGQHPQNRFHLNPAICMQIAMPAIPWYLSARMLR